MALQADITIGDESQSLHSAQSASYIKVIDTRKDTDDKGNDFLMYEVAVYPDETARLADEEPWSKQQACPHVDRFKITNYTPSGSTETDRITDAYNHLKLQGVVINTKDV